MLLLWLGFLVGSLDDLPDATQFARLVSSELDVLQDQAFVFEGERSYLGPTELYPDSPVSKNWSFQGSYAARSDGSIFLDIYGREKEAASGPLGRQTGVIFKSRTEMGEGGPDTRARTVRTLDYRSPRSLLGLTGSPMRISRVWFFQPSEGIELTDYKAHGFESVDGHRCLHVEFNEIPGPNVVRSLRRHLWVDLERGGHALRVEYYTDGTLQSRSNIQVESVVTADGKAAWFPMSGTEDVFTFGPRTYDQPMVRYDIHVVAASLRINSGLDDAVFSLNSMGGAADTTSLHEFRKDFLEQTPPPKFRTDPKGVQERLDHDLAKAEKEAAQLDASNPRPEGEWTTWLQAALGALGVVAIGLGIYLKRRLG